MSASATPSYFVRTIGFDDRVAHVNAQGDDKVGSLRDKVAAQGINTRGNHLFYDMEYLEDKRTIGEYGIPPNSSIKVVPAIPGLPPSGCCCYSSTYTGVRVFTRVFIALQVLGMLAALLGGLVNGLFACTFSANGRCPRAPGRDPFQTYDFERDANGSSPQELYARNSALVAEQAEFASLVAGSVAAGLIFLWCLVSFAVGVYGLRRINARDADGVKCYLYMQAALLVLTFLGSLGITFPLYAWYVYALKVLWDELKREESGGKVQLEA
jgi:hypothetical protein